MKNDFKGFSSFKAYTQVKNWHTLSFKDLLLTNDMNAYKFEKEL